MNNIKENILKHFGANEITSTELITWFQANKYQNFKLTITPDDNLIRIFDLTIGTKFSTNSFKLHAFN